MTGLYNMTGLTTKYIRTNTISNRCENMRKIIQYIIAIFLITALINTAYGFPGMANRSSNTSLNISSNTSSNTQIDLNDTTQSDQDIQLLQSLIELDTVQFQSENKLYVRETLIFKNTGLKNFYGMLRIWVPDGSEGIKVGKLEMMTGGATEFLNHVQNGNIVSWQDIIEKNNSLPPLYTVEYMLTAQSKAGTNEPKYYSKKLLYPTLINKVPGSVILKVTKSKEDTVAITDENGNSISASGNPQEEDNSILYGWTAPTFTDINIKISKTAATPSGIAGYAILGVLVLLIFSYPVIRKRSEKIQTAEERIRSSLKREKKVEPSEEIEEERADGTDEEMSEKTASEVSLKSDVEFMNKTKDELVNEKNETLSKLSGLDKEYASGNMLDEEYEDLRKTYQKRLTKITKRIKQLG